MRRIIRATAAWNPAMWAGFTGQSAALSVAAQWFIAIPSLAICFGLCFCALAVTIKSEATK